MGTVGLAARRSRSGVLAAGALAVVLLCSSWPAALAQPELDRARARTDRLEASIGTARTEAGRLQLRILALAADLQDSRAALDRLRARLIRSEHALVDAREELDALELRLAARARSAFIEMGPGADAAYLLGAGSFADLMERTAMLGRFQASDAALAEEVAARSARLRDAADGLAAQTTERARLLSRVQERRSALLTAFADQQAELARLNEAHDRASRHVHAVERRVARRSGALPFGDWASRFLAHIGAPRCQENLIVMVAWQANEFTEARWNPLATTHRMRGSSSFNPVGVQNFRTLTQGLRATEETLTGGAASYGYAAILQGLRACTGAKVTADAIRASAWCRGCSLGAYVTGLIPIVREYFQDYAAKHA
jgi:peptidoglycan hydrolase CwlO-like protein